MHTFLLILPFLLILALWFFLLWAMRRRKGIGYKYQVDMIREALREELTPEIRALRESVEALRKDLNDRR